MFKNLRTSTKLLLLCGMFVISIATTTVALVAEKQIAIAFAHKELVGSRYLAIVRDIYPAILIQQNDPSFAKTRLSPDEILKAVAAAEASAVNDLQTAELEQALAQTLRKLWSDKTVQNTDQLIIEALSNEQKLASRIGDDSNLALDPDVYRHGRASRSQSHPSAECLHLKERLPAFPYLAQSEPYSRAVKSAHDLIASASAAARLPLPELLPEWK